jgi:DNA polymerase III delta subunit
VDQIPDLVSNWFNATRPIARSSFLPSRFSFLGLAAMIHLILGPDYSMVREATRKRALASDPDGQSTSTMDGKAVSIQDVAMAAASIGFFSAGRTIIVEDLLARFAKGNAKSDTDWKALFSGVPAETTLILADPSVVSMPAAVKKALPDTADVLLCDPPRGRDLIDWIVGRAKSQGGKIDKGTAQTLAMTLYPAGWSQKSRNPAFDRPPDMEALVHEIDKLVIAAHPGSVTEDHIRELIATGDNDQIFTFIDAASGGNIAKAVTELDRLLAAGEDPYKILSQLSSSGELAAVMSRADRRDPADVGRELRLSNPARMTSVARSVRDQPQHFAPRVVRVLEETDRQIKTGEIRDPVDALYSALAGIAGLRRARS